MSAARPKVLLLDLGNVTVRLRSAEFLVAQARVRGHQSHLVKPMPVFTRIANVRGTTSRYSLP